MAGAGHRSDDILDVVDRVGDATVLGNGVVEVIDVSLVIDHHVLEQCVAPYCAVNVGFAVRIKVDGFCIAAAFKIENALVVPAMLVIADETALGVGGKGRLAGARETEENGDIPRFAHVGTAVHGGHVIQRQVIVHHREHAFLHLAAVPGAADHLHFLGHVEHGEHLGIHAVLAPVRVGRLGAVEDHEIGLAVVCQLFLGRTDEHVLHEMRLPGHLDDKAHFHAYPRIGAAEGIDDEQPFP